MQARFVSGLPGKILLLIVAISGCALLFEAGIRILHPQNLINNEPIYRFDPAFEKRLIPKATFQFATPEYEYTVTTNSIGFRRLITNKSGGYAGMRSCPQIKKAANNMATFALKIVL